VLLLDAIRAVEQNPGDGQAAIDEMVARGAEPVLFSAIENEDRERRLARRFWGVESAATDIRQ